MLNILKTEPCVPCHATVGSFFFSAYKLFFTGRFFESGRKHSVDPVREPRRNVKMEEMGQITLWLHSVFLWPVSLLPC